MENTNLIQNGFFLVKVRKCVNLYAWAETEDELFKYTSRSEYPASKGWKVAAHFKEKNGTKEYLQIDGKLVRTK